MKGATRRRTEPLRAKRAAASLSANGFAEIPEYDWDEILRHNQPGDFWVAMGGGVYDVSEWIYHHPGGPEVYIENYGHDASQAFSKAGHTEEAWKLAQSFKVGRLKEGDTPPK